MGRHCKPPHRTPRACACGDHGFVGLTQCFVAFFDVGDLPLIKRFTWGTLTTSKRPYARTHNGEKIVLMHRAITKCPKGKVVDHKNHDTLDNRRGNLRVCTQAQNLWNSRKHSGDKTSRLKGAYLHRDGKWCAHICRNGVRNHLGYFGTEQEAHAAYVTAAKKIDGEFLCVKDARRAS